MPIVRRRATDTLTAVELDHGDVLEYTLSDGHVFRMTLLETEAWPHRVETHATESGPVEVLAVYRFACVVEIDGREHRLVREVGSQASFYQPWSFGGVTLFVDGVQAIFDFLAEDHGECRPNRHGRFALQEQGRPICPEPLHRWCPLPERGLTIDQCYRGEDCWMGPFNGRDAHGGLDINHPACTPLWTPVSLDDQFYFNSLEMGHNNNRWRGLRRWPDGSQWILQAHHMTRLLVPEHTPLERGTHYADGAGVLSGAADHSHFVFRIHDLGETISLDPWILFREMRGGRLRGSIESIK